MSLNFYFGGCSFTLGEELQDKEKSRFSKIVSDVCGATEHNISCGGASNFKIVRDFLENYEKENWDLVVIMWTSLDRFEHYTGMTKWTSFDGYEIVTPTRIFPNLGKRKKIDTGIDLTDQYAQRPDVKNALAEYYIHVNTPAQTVMNFLHHIITIQSLCKAKNIPYILTNFYHKATQDTIDKVIKYSQQNNPAVAEHIQQRVDMIDWSNKVWLNGKDFAFLEFAEESKLPIGIDKHPLEEGHAHLGSILVNHYRKYYNGT